MTEQSNIDQIMQKVVCIFNELSSIVEIIKNDFEREKSEDPRLTIPIVNNYLGIVNSYKKSFASLAERGVHSKEDLKKFDAYSLGFARAFENPFLGSQRWYQRISQLLDQFSLESRELRRLIQMRDDNS